MYEKMKKELTTAIKNNLADTYKVVAFPVVKGKQTLDAFVIVDSDTCASPTFYFKDYFEDYCKNVPAEVLAKEIIGLHYFTLEHACVNIDDFKDFKKQKDKITYKVVNTKEYSRQLPYIPHIEFHDLSIIFYCVHDINEERCLSYIISNAALKLWEISKSELFMIAQTNIQKIFPLKIVASLQAILDEEVLCLNVKNTVKSLPHDAFYIVSNIYNSDGFANIFTPDLLTTFAEKFGDFYIMPVSVDEALFVPTSFGLGVSDIKTMLRDINDTITEPGLFLSNSVYRYNKETGKVDAFLG